MSDLRTLKDLGIFNDGTLEEYNEDVSAVYVKELIALAKEWIKFIDNKKFNRITFSVEPYSKMLKLEQQKNMIMFAKSFCKEQFKQFFNLSEEDLK